MSYQVQVVVPQAVHLCSSYDVPLFNTITINNTIPLPKHGLKFKDGLGMKNSIKTALVPFITLLSVAHYETIRNAGSLPLKFSRLRGGLVYHR